MPSLIDPQLHAFWVAARQRSLTRAADQLGVSADALEADLQALELRLRVSLVSRSGDRIGLTRAGQDTLRACDEMVALGAGLDDVLRGHRAGFRVERLRVGVADVVPKVLAWRLLAPARDVPGSRVRLSCAEGRQDRLMHQVEQGGLDLVLSDGPLSSERDLGAETLLLGDCGVSLFATPGLARELERGGSDWLHRAPLPAARARHDAPRRPRSVVSTARAAAHHRGRVRRQRAAQVLRCGGGRRLRDARRRPSRARGPIGLRAHGGAERPAAAGVRGGSP
jgi:LysR family transcriptional activator of nhaA